VAAVPRERLPFTHVSTVQPEVSVSPTATGSDSLSASVSVFSGCPEAERCLVLPVPVPVYASVCQWPVVSVVTSTSRSYFKLKNRLCVRGGRTTTVTVCSSTT
jgi:hypothetical protein